VLQPLTGLSQRWTREPIQWRVPLIVAGVLFLSATIAYLAPPLLALLLLVAMVGLVVVGILARWPLVGFLALIATNMVIPIMLGTGTQSAVNGTVLLLLLLTGLWLFKLVQRDPSHMLSSRTFLPLMGFIVVAILSFVSGQLPWFAVEAASLTAQIGGLAVFVLSAAGFLLAAHEIRTLRWLQWITWLFVVLGAIYIVGRVVPGLFRHVGPLFLWGATASQFWIWLAAIVFSQALFNQELRLPWRLALWVLFAAIFYAALTQTFDWTSGWLPPLAAVAAIVALRWSRFAVGLALTGIALVPAWVSQLLLVEEYSYSTRLDAWKIVFDIIKVNPVLGLGPANYYWYTSLYSIRGYFVEFNSHNQYLDLLAQTGILGLLFFLWFFWVVGRLGNRLRHRVPAGFAQAYVYGALGGLAGMLVSGMLGDWVLPFVYNVGLVGMRSSILGWLFLGALVALERMTSTEGRPLLEDAHERG
jgi:O-antigen ligase